MHVRILVVGMRPVVYGWKAGKPARTGGIVRSLNAGPRVGDHDTLRSDRHRSASGSDEGIGEKGEDGDLHGFLPYSAGAGMGPSASTSASAVAVFGASAVPNRE
jgi:hypothetical protein